MNATIMYSSEELAKMEIKKFLAEGLKDVRDNNLLDFDAVFAELEKRYDVNG